MKKTLDSPGWSSGAESPPKLSDKDDVLKDAEPDARNEVVFGEKHDRLERFRALLDHASDLIFLIDLESGLIVDANNSACKLIGVACADLIGRSLERVLDLEQLNWLGDPEHAPDEGSVATIIRRRGGGVSPVEVRFNMDQFGGSAYGVVVARDTSKQREFQEALQDRDEQLRSIIESTPLGIHLYRLDENGELIFSGANPAADAILGIRHGHLIGRTLEEAFPGLVETEVPARYRDVCGKGIPWRKEQVLYRNESIQGAYEVYAFPTGAGRMAAMFMDITERKIAEEALQESSRMKTEFISTAAHELRTPVTSIRGFSQVLVSHPRLTPEEQRESLNYIHQKAEALSKILDDLLDIARVESGQALALNKRRIKIDELLRPSAVFLKPQAEKYNLSWSLEDSGSEVLADPDRVNQIMENLLSNALKYSPQGSDINIRGQRHTQEYRITVADRGIGMTPEQNSRVFDKFFRADSSNTAVSGLGLGMSIVRDLVSSHSGRIWVESSPGTGTRVFFTLPLIQNGRPENRGER